MGCCLIDRHQSDGQLEATLNAKKSPVNPGF